jgi:predicted TIM-barrel fold metal-dependent hydrolase
MQLICTSVKETAKMLITDSQVHVWEAHRPDRPWPSENQGKPSFVAVPGARPHRAEPINGLEMTSMMNSAGVYRAIIVPPSPVGDSNLFALETAANYPGRFLVMGRFNPTAAGALTQLPTWLDQAYMAGIRMTFHKPEWANWLADGVLEGFWRSCENYRIPVMLLAPGRMTEIDRIASRYPNLTLIVDHLGMHSHHRDSDCGEDLKTVLPLARHPNVSIKTSAVPCYTNEPFPFRNFNGYLEAIYQSFGPRRMLWGSDVSRLPCTYIEAVTHFTETLDFISKEDLPWVMGRSLYALLRWAEPNE